MTIEEAAEIILRNQPYINCINCEGMGWVHRGISTITLHRCSSCRGTKKQLLLDYEIACNVLGLEVRRRTFMTLEEAVEVLMVSTVTITCTQCRGRGVVPGSNFISRENGHEEVVFCKNCEGSRVIWNPIWARAWLIVHPGDLDGMQKRRNDAVAAAWSRRTLFA
jgi:RecJ-like exonuclease